MAITRIGVQPIIATVGDAPARQTYMVVEGDQKSVPVSCENDLSIKGNVNIVHWQGKGGKTKVYRSDGLGFGLVGETGETLFVDDNIAPDLKKHPPADLTSNSPPE